MSKYSLTPEQHRRRAQRLWHRHARAAEMHELAAAMQESLAKTRNVAGTRWQPTEAKAACAPPISRL
jgi:hypothetical protein